MTSKELLKETLEKWKFPILDETETSVAFRFQMNYVHITALNDDSPRVAVLLSRVFHADDDREERLGLKTCNELNYRMMQAKLYFDPDKDLTISCEFFYDRDEAFEPQLHMALRAVVSGKKQFLSLYKETEAEDKLMQELDEQDE